MSNNTVLSVDITNIQTTSEATAQFTREAAAQPVEHVAGHQAEVTAAESIKDPRDEPADNIEESADDFTDNYIDQLKREYALHLSNEPKKPRKFKVLYDNTNPEAMFRGMVANGASVALASDEADKIFNGRAMNDLAMMNSARDGSPIQVDRVEAGSAIVRDPRFTFMAMIQPGAFRKYFERRGEEALYIGFFARCFFSFPLSTQGTRQIRHVPPSWQHLPKFHERVTEILAQNLIDMEDAAYTRPILEFSPEATQVWIDAFNEVESFLYPGQYFADISDYGSKFAENLARLAGLLHYFTGQQGEISYETTNRALAICRWYMTEFKRLFGAQPEVPLEVLDANELEEWLVKLCRRYPGWTEIKKNVIAQLGPNQLRSSKIRREAALYILAINNKLRFELRGKTTVLVLNPLHFPVPNIAIFPPFYQPQLQGPMH